MNPNFLRIFFIIELMLLVFFKIISVKLIEWRNAPPSIMEGSPDAYYHISRLYVQLGLLAGLCFGISIGVLCIYFFIRKKMVFDNLFDRLNIFLVFIPPIVLCWIGREFL